MKIHSPKPMYLETKASLNNSELGGTIVMDITKQSDSINWSQRKMELQYVTTSGYFKSPLLSQVLVYSASKCLFPRPAALPQLFCPSAPLSPMGDQRLSLCSSCPVVICSFRQRFAPCVPRWVFSNPVQDLGDLWSLVSVAHTLHPPVLCLCLPGPASAVWHHCPARCSEKCLQAESQGSCSQGPQSCMAIVQCLKAVIYFV